MLRKSLTLFPNFLISCLISLVLLSGLLLPAPLNSVPASAAPRALTPIYDIQYTTEPGGDGLYPSLLVGQVVTTTGIVYAVYGGGFCIADAGGPWHGVYVYYPSGDKPQLGDLVKVQGEVAEYYGLTELAEYATYTVLSSGNPMYDPSVVTTTVIPFADPNTSEPYESVLVEIHNITVTQEPDTHWIWTFTDTGGAAAKADDWGYRADPAVGDTYALLRGALLYDYSEYKVMPRDENDLVQGPHMAVDKQAAVNVLPGELLTYTISLQNNTLISLTGIVITDAIPISNAVIAEVLDGGVLDGDAISWTVSSLPIGGQLQVRFVLTATGTVGDLIVNRSYAAWAANWPERAVGGPLTTVIGNYTPIPMIQGDGLLSPLQGYNVRTRGVVVGFFEGNYSGGGGFDGFFIQDPTGDGITTTSDGIFVDHGSLNVNVNVGDWVTVTGTVNEASEWDDGDCLSDECQTEILVADTADVEVGGSGAVTPVLIDPPGDSAAGLAYYESLEGMLLTLAQTGTVVGPTSYGTVIVVAGSLGVERVLRTGPYAGMPVGLRHYLRYGDFDVGDPPNLIVGSTITGANGPLAWSFGNYIVTTQQGAQWEDIYSRPVPDVPTWPIAGPDEFTLLSFNVENFFDTIDDTGHNDPVISPEDYAIKLTKIARSIAAANCPTIVGLQEAEKVEVLEDVADVLSVTYGCTYAATLTEGLDGRGIDVGYLTRDDRVTIEGVWQYQDCTDYDTGLGQGDCPSGQHLLFSRIPLVMTATIQLDSGSAEVILIVNHLKSKHSRSGDPQSAQWRLLQAQSVATLTHRLIEDNPDILLSVLGDLNDFEDSEPMEALYTTGLLTNTWYTLPPEARYSYIYKGLCQILDHVLLSPAMQYWLDEAGVLHYNADFPHNPFAEDDSVIWRTTDHDLPAATFQTPPNLFDSTKTADPETLEPGALLSYTIHLSNTGSNVTVALTDVLPAEVTVLTPTLPAGLVYSDGLLLWSGVLSSGAQLDLAFQAQVGTGLANGHTFSNVVWIDDSVHTPFSREAGVRVEILCDPVSAADFDWSPITPVEGEVLTFTAWIETGWLNEVVDGAGAVGQFASLALDGQGRPHISFYDQDNAALKYAHDNGTTWQVETVDTGSVGQYSTLAIDAAGRPHISYYDEGNAALKYAHYDGASWTIKTVDADGDAGLWTSLALDSAGHPYIGYHVYDYGDLRLAHHDGTAWQVETVDSSGVVGRYTSLALDATGYPYISFYDVFATNLKYAAYDGTAWQIETVDSAGSVGTGTSLVLDATGNPYISYLDGDNDALKLASYDGSAWTIETVAGAGQAGSDTTLALDVDGYPHVAYYDWAADALNYAGYDGSAWLIETVDGSAGHASGSAVSLALDSAGRPHLGYLDAGDTDLLYAHLPVPPSEPFTYTWDLGDGNLAEGDTITHTYDAAGPYTVNLTAANLCGEVTVVHTVEIASVGWKVYLPLIFKNAGH